MGREQEAAAAPGMPLWAKVAGLVALAVLAAVVVLHLTGNSLGSHGP